MLLKPDHSAPTAAPPPPAPSYPSHWDRRIAPYAKIAAHERGLSFLHPVPVRFLSPAKFAKTLATDDKDLSKDDRGSSSTPPPAACPRADHRRRGPPRCGQRLPERRRRRVLLVQGPADHGPRSPRDAGGEGDPGPRAHPRPPGPALPHRGPGPKKLGRSPTKGPDNSQAPCSTPSSRATRPAGAAPLRRVARAAPAAGTRRQSEQAEVARREAPDLARPAGGAGDDGAPRTPWVRAWCRRWRRTAATPPSTGCSATPRPTSPRCSTPSASWPGGTAAKKVAVPKILAGEKKFDSGELGVLTWYVMLAQRLPLPQALAAADGWGGDAFVAFQHDGTTCVRADYTGRTPADTARMYTALLGWQAAAPGTSATVSRAGGVVRIPVVRPRRCGRRREGRRPGSHRARGRDPGRHRGRSDASRTPAVGGALHGRPDGRDLHRGRAEQPDLRPGARRPGRSSASSRQGAPEPSVPRTATARMPGWRDDEAGRGEGVGRRAPAGPAGAVRRTRSGRGRPGRG